MDKNIYNFKCSIPGHESEDTILICLSHDCQKSSRFACQICAIDYHSVHMNKCVSVKQMLGSKQDYPFIKNWPQNPDVTKILSFIYDNQQSEEQVTNYVNKIFEEFKQNVIIEIEKAKTEVLQKLIFKQQTIQEFCLQLNQILVNTFNLTDLQTILNDYQKKNQDEKLVVQKIEKFSQNPTRMEKEIQLLQLFQEYNQENEKEDLIISEDIFKQQTNNILYQIKYLQYKIFKTNLYFDISQYKQSQEKVKILKNIIIFEPNTTYSMIYSTRFSKKDNVTLKFKINGDLKHCFQFGIIPKGSKHNNVHFFDSGNHICLFCKKFRKEFVLQQGKKHLWDVYGNQTIILNFELCVEKNKLIIYDEAKTAYLENNYQFEEEFDEWRVAFLSGQQVGYKVEILSFFKVIPV